jgi:signal peptidase II
MKHKTRNIFFKPLLTLPLLVVIDQLSKYIFRHPPAGGGGFYICNPNIALGIPMPPAVFWTFWAGIVFFISGAFWKLLAKERSEELAGRKSRLKYWAFSLILAGAFSNMLDRLTLGCVVDFIDFKIWPVFNLADAMVVFGVAALFVKTKKHAKITS